MNPDKCSRCGEFHALITCRDGVNYQSALPFPQAPAQDQPPKQTEMPPHIYGYYQTSPWENGWVFDLSKGDLDNIEWISTIENTAILAEAIQLARRNAFEEAAQMIRKFPRATQDTIIASLEAKASGEKP